METRVLSRVKVGLVAGVLLLVLIAFWLTRPVTSSDKAQVYTHIHCPECFLEMTYSPTLERKPCPQCGPKGPVMIPTVGPCGGPGAVDVGMFGKFLATSVMVLAAIVGIAYALAQRRQAFLQAEEEARNIPLVCRCPSCERKISYSQRKVGRPALCPRCKSAFVLPKED